MHWILYHMGKTVRDEHDYDGYIGKNRVALLRSRGREERLVVPTGIVPTNFIRCAH